MFDEIFPFAESRQLPVVDRQPPEEAYVEDCPDYFISAGPAVICTKYGVVCSNYPCIHGREKCQTKE